MTFTKRAYGVGDGEGYEENFLLANKVFFLAQLWRKMSENGRQYSKFVLPEGVWHCKHNEPDTGYRGKRDKLI